MVEQSLGLAPTAAIKQLADALISRDLEVLLQLLDELESRGVEATTISRQLAKLITSAITAYAPLLPLLDNILRVGDSPLPGAALIAQLGLWAEPQPQRSDVDIKPVKKKQAAALGKKAPRLEPEPVQPVVPTKSSVPEKKTLVAKSSSHDHSTLDWQAVTMALRAKSIGLASVLDKCSIAANDETLTIYTKTAFYEKKLQSKSYLAALHAGLS